MPIPIAVDDDRRGTAMALEEMGRLVNSIRADPNAPPPRASFRTLRARLERIDQILEAAIVSGGVKPAQLSQIATQFEAVARELRPRRRRTAATRASASRTRKAGTKRTATRRTARRKR
jgi:hypothetical protein